MILAVAGAILMQGASPDITNTDSAGNHTQWLARPSAKSLVDCVRGRLPAVRVVLACRTAPKDRLADCAPAPGYPAAPEAVTKVAICMSKAYRIRASAPDGTPVTGTTVLVPLTISDPR
jgi:hypothetical protein